MKIEPDETCDCGQRANHPGFCWYELVVTDDGVIVAIWDFDRPKPLATKSGRRGR